MRSGRFLVQKRHAYFVHLHRRSLSFLTGSERMSSPGRATSGRTNWEQRPLTEPVDTDHGKLSVRNVPFRDELNELWAVAGGMSMTTTTRHTRVQKNKRRPYPSSFSAFKCRTVTMFFILYQWRTKNCLIGGWKIDLYIMDSVRPLRQSSHLGTRPLLSPARYERY